MQNDDPNDEGMTVDPEGERNARTGKHTSEATPAGMMGPYTRFEADSGIGRFWSDGPTRSAESDLGRTEMTPERAAFHERGTPDFSAFETNYGDEAQDSSSGAPEGSWSIPTQVGPSGPWLSTNE